MTLAEETYVLGEERERLDERLDELAAKLVDADEGSTAAQAILDAANTVDTRGEGVAWLIEQHGPDAEVTVAALTAGDYARVQDRLAGMAAQAGQSADLPGSRTNIYAAAGLVDAPFLDGDEDFDARIEAVADQPVGVAQWLEGRVNHVTTRGSSEGNWDSLEDRLAERTAES